MRIPDSRPLPVPVPGHAAGGRTEARHLEHRLAHAPPGDPDLPRDLQPAPPGRPRPAGRATPSGWMPISSPCRRWMGRRPRPGSSTPRLRLLLPRGAMTCSAPASPSAAACASPRTRDLDGAGPPPPCPLSRSAAAPTSRSRPPAASGCACSRCTSNAGCRSTGRWRRPGRDCEKLARQAEILAGWVAARRRGGHRLRLLGDFNRTMAGPQDDDCCAPWPPRRR